MFRSPNQHPVLQSRVKRTPNEQIWVSVISADEAIMGARSLIHNRKGNMFDGYRLLTKILTFYSRFQFLVYDEAAHSVFNGFTGDAARVSKPDRRIAATAISKDYIVVTQNIQDFQRIPDVQYEDWTIEPTLN